MIRRKHQIAAERVSKGELNFEVGEDARQKQFLSKPWERASLLAWVVFVFFQTYIGWNGFGVCSKSLENFSLYRNVCCTISGAFGVIWLIILTRIIHSKRIGLDISAHLSYFNVATMGLCTALLCLIFHQDNMCIDYFGVATPSIVWGEWVAAGPLLIVTVLTTITEKHRMDYWDWIIVSSFFLSLLCGFLVVVASSIPWAAFCFVVLAFVFYFPMLVLPWYIPPPPKGMNAEDPSYHRHTVLRTVVLFITFTMPLFPVAYLLAAKGIINQEQSAIAFSVLPMLTKGIYAVVLLDLNVDSAVTLKWMLRNELGANDSRRAFMKYLFHEVRTPLNSLSMGIDILEQSGAIKEPAERESLMMMRSASEFMASTLNDVLSMQKIEEGKMELDMRSFNLTDAVGNVFNTFRGAAVGKQINLTLSFQDNMPARVVGDRFKLEHTIANLVSNAIKFSPVGGTITVTLSSIVSSSHEEGERTDGMPLVAKEEELVTLIVEVQDEGPGISPENQLRLFGNFVQINAADLQQGQGSGLGLSLCKQMVELQGGNLSVSSTEGVGSTFRISIPVWTVPNTPPSLNNRSQTISRNKMDTKAPQELLSTHKDIYFALIVDDSEPNRKMLKTLLTKSEVSVSLAENGKIAVDMVLKDKDKYDIIFMDSEMPVMDGLTATRTLRDGGFENLIVGVTGNVLDEDVQTFLSAGADTVLGKPLRLNVISSLLRFMDMEGCMSRFGLTLRQKDNSFEWADYV